MSLARGGVDWCLDGCAVTIEWCLREMLIHLLELW